MNLKKIIGTRLFEAFGRACIRRAVRTPYTHLRQANGYGYMDRYWLFRLGKSGGGYPWIGARIHYIQSSDDDRAFHDHPWPFITIILRGGYSELRPKTRGAPCNDAIHTRIGGQYQWATIREYVAGAILRRKATDWHALQLPPGGEAVTLFIEFPKVQSWGFLWKGAKVYYRDFERMEGGSGVYVSEFPARELTP